MFGRRGVKQQEAGKRYEMRNSAIHSSPTLTGVVLSWWKRWIGHEVHMELLQNIQNFS
jgi:hypothetical protein